MTTVEKSAYLKGLADGLGYTGDSREGKIWSALCDLVSDMAHEIEDLQMNGIDFAEALNDITESVNYLEELTADFDLPDEFEDNDNEIISFSDIVGEDEGWDSLEEEDEDSLLEEGDEVLQYDGIMYDALCPVCGEEISFDEETLAKGSVVCPGCGETLEFDLDEDEDI